MRRWRRRSSCRGPGLRAADKPIGNFLFAGPDRRRQDRAGAAARARSSEVEFLRFDMSEYMEKHAVSRLIGAPPGYVGYEEGGLLIDAVRKSPHAVLLLDEIEKAHPDLFSILLQVMDHATLTDTHGRKADFRHVILIMTTNVGARDLSDRKMGFGETRRGSSSRGALERMFSPEFRNRLDATVHFSALGAAEIERVVDKHIAELQALLAPRHVTIELAAGGARVAGRQGFRPRVRRPPDGAADRAAGQEAAGRSAAVRRAQGRRPRDRRGAGRRPRAALRRARGRVAARMLGRGDDVRWGRASARPRPFACYARSRFEHRHGS